MNEFSINYRATNNKITQDLSGLSYVVRSYSKNRYVGPAALEVDAHGSASQLGTLLNRLGAGIIVTDNLRGQPVWWGRINEIAFHDENITVKFSLDKTSNKTACRYNYLDDSGVTAFVEDADSQDAYGILELILSKSDTSPAAALAYATSENNFLRFPQPIIKIGNNNQVYATISGESWLHPTQQRYYNQDAGLETFDGTGSGNQPLGDTAANETIAMSVVELSSSTGWDIKKIAVRLRREETPTDNIELHLMSDAPGVPSATLASKSLVGADLDEGMSRVEFEFAAAYSAATVTKYWFALTRSGAADSTNYYVVEMDEDLGADGELLIYDGSDWAGREQDADMPYWIYGEDETSDQISDILDDTAEFIDRAVIKADSGVFTNQYRDDSPVAWDEFAQHMDNGTENGLRYTGLVDIDRFLTIDEEPSAVGRSTPLLGSDGKLRHPSGTLFPPEDCYIGWVKLSELEFISSLSDDFVDLVSSIYVDEAEYRGGLWRPVATRGAGKSADALKGTLQG